MIGEAIKNYRRKMDMTQREFAKKLGVYQPMVADWESGRKEPKLFYAICIADMLNISLDELVGRTVAK